MATSKRDKPRDRTTPNKHGDVLERDDELEAEAWDELEDNPKESLFEKAKGVMRNVFHEEQHLPKKPAELKEAHRVQLDDSMNFEGLPINKVPGKFRKYVTKR